jgi:hypothetical protein
LRTALFGPALACTTACPACALRLEMEFTVDALRVPDAGAPPADLHIEHAGYTLNARLPTALDLAHAAAVGDIPGARRALLEACVVDASFQGATRSALDLPDDLVSHVGAVMAAADPQAATAIAMQCPGCGHDWEAPFDIAAYLWRELDAWARRLLLEVHSLARHYGWTEPDVLALSSARRQAYLEMVGA